jgi:fused signal recognition particle receptor
MANAVQDIIALGRKLEEAQAQFERIGSVDRAVAESEARLAATRAAEERAEADFEAACRRRETDGTERERQARARALALDASEAARRATFEEKYRQAVEAVEAHLAEGREAVAKAEARAAELEAEETRLAQSVTALKAELAALRARVLG